MKSPITLTRSEYSDLCQALIIIRDVDNTLKNVLASVLTKKLRTGMALAEQALRRASKEDDILTNRLSDFYSEMASKYQFSSVWSIYEVDDFDEKHPYKGAKELQYGVHWGKNLVKVPINGPTWLDLWRAADQAIAQSGDTHHVFVEDFSKRLEEPGVLTLTVGS